MFNGVQADKNSKLLQGGKNIQATAQPEALKKNATGVRHVVAKIRKEVRLQSVCYSVRVCSCQVMTSRFQVSEGHYSPRGRGRSRTAASVHCLPDGYSPHGSYGHTKVLASMTPCYYNVLYCVTLSCYRYNCAARAQILLHPAKHCLLEISYMLHNVTPADACASLFNQLPWLSMQKYEPPSLQAFPHSAHSPTRASSPQQHKRVRSPEVCALLY